MKKLLIAITLLLSMTTQVMAQAVFESHRDDFTGEDNNIVLIEKLSGDDMFLGWKCINGTLDMLVGHPYIGGHAETFPEIGKTFYWSRMQYRFDDETPSPKDIHLLSKSKEITHFGKNKIPLLSKKALSSNQVMIRVIDPLDDDTYTSTFKLAGLDEALPKLECVDSLESIQ